MDQELKENLPIFSVLALGGILILAMSGVILWQQFRVVSTDVQKIEQPAKTEQKVDASIVGTWESRHPSTGKGEKRFVFQSNGRYTEQYYYQGSIWPKARGTFTYDVQTSALNLNQEDIYQYATFDPPVASRDRIEYKVEKLTGAELCIQNILPGKGMYGCLALFERDDKARPAKDPNFSVRSSNPIVGTWESEHQKISGETAKFFGGDGEIYTKWVFNADGTFQQYLVNSTMKPPAPPLVDGEFRVGTYQFSLGPVDVIAFTEFRVGEQDHRNMIGSEEAEILELINLRVDSPNRICISSPTHAEPSKLSEDRWECLNRVNN